MIRQMTSVAVKSTMAVWMDLIMPIVPSAPVLKFQWSPLRNRNIMTKPMVKEKMVGVIPKLTDSSFQEGL
jgi:hypothetical protein